MGVDPNSTLGGGLGSSGQTVGDQSSITDQSKSDNKQQQTTNQQSWATGDMESWDQADQKPVYQVLQQQTELANGFTDRNIIVSVKSSDKNQANYIGGNVATQVSGGQVYIRSTTIDTANISILAAEELLINNTTADGITNTGGAGNVDNTVGTGGGTTGNTGGGGSTGNTVDARFVGFLEASEDYEIANYSSQDYYGGPLINTGDFSEFYQLDFGHALSANLLANLGGGIMQEPAALAYKTSDGGFKVPGNGAGTYKLKYNIRIEIPDLFFHKNLQTAPVIPQDIFIQSIAKNGVELDREQYDGTKSATPQSLYADGNQMIVVNKAVQLANQLFQDSDSGLFIDTWHDFEMERTLQLQDGDVITAHWGWKQNWTKDLNGSPESFGFVRSVVSKFIMSPKYSQTRLLIEKI